MWSEISLGNNFYLDLGLNLQFGSLLISGLGSLFGVSEGETSVGEAAVVSQLIIFNSSGFFSLY